MLEMKKNKDASIHMNIKNTKNNHQTAPHIHCIMDVQVIWYAECNESQIKCIKDMLMGQNPKWQP